MPEMTVWPVSSSVRTWKVGSSSERLKRALPILSWSTLVFGSTATWITGSGNSRFSSTISVHRGREGVAGACVLEPDAGRDVTGEDARPRPRGWLACICRMRPMRSLLLWVVFTTVPPFSSAPE